MANLYGNICTCTRCNGIVHTIRKGDTLYLLSRHYNVSVNDIMNANRNVNIYNLRIGDEICIPVRRRMDMRGDNEMREGMNEELRDEFPGNVINDMSVESVENESKVHTEEKKDDDKDRDRDRDRKWEHDREWDRNRDRKLREILDMDMTLFEFLKMLKEFDK